VRLTISGPEPPRFSSLRDVIDYAKPSRKTVRGPIRAKLRTRPSVRKQLRTRRKPLRRGVRATLELRAGRDVTTVYVGGVLRRSR
jgi:hypothetical protein